MSKRRHKLSRKGAKRLYKATAARTHVKNLRASPMRGGFRI